NWPASWPARARCQPGPVNASGQRASGISAFAGGAKIETRVCYPARIGYSSVRTPGTITAAVSLAGWHADVAQLVEHHLAKVRVAGSNPVVRSETPNAVGSDPRLSGSMVSLLRWSFGRWKSF